MTGVSLLKNKQLLDEAEDRGERLLTIVKADAGKNPLGKNEDEARREINADRRSAPASGHARRLRTQRSADLLPIRAVLGQPGLQTRTF